MNVSETDTFTVFQKKHFVDRDYFLTSVVWKIFHVGNRTYVHDEIQQLVSPAIPCSNYLFDLALRPGNLKDDPEVSIYLRKLNEAGNCHLYFKLKVYNLKNKKVHQSSTFEWINFYYTQYKKKIPSKNMLNPKDEKQYVTIFLDLLLDGADSAADSFRRATEVLKDEIINLMEHNDFISLARDFEELYNDPVSADVTLKIGTEEIPAHKCVLSRSSVFRAMFTHCMQETQENAVCITEMEVKTFKDLLRYMYCGKVRQLTPEEVLNLYVAADRYQLAELVTICRELMTNALTLKNVCFIAEIATLHNDECLIDILKSFLKENSPDLIETEEWKVFSVSKPFLALKILEWAVSRQN